MLEKNITDESHLLTTAKKCHDLSEKDLYHFVENRTPKAISDLVETACRIHSAPEIIRREKTARINIVSVRMKD